MCLSHAHFTRQSFLTCALEGFSLTHAYAPEFSSLCRAPCGVGFDPIRLPSRRPERHLRLASGVFFFFPRFPFPPSRFFPSPCSLFPLISFFPTEADPGVVSLGSGWWERAIFSWKRGGVGNTVNWGIWRPRAGLECFVCCKRSSEGGKEVFPGD